jgi:2-methylcitrate dehydratase PrpD
MSLTGTVIDFIVATDFKDLSKEAVDATKKLFLDTTGVALAGSKAAGIEATLNLLRTWGGRAESTVWVHRFGTAVDPFFIIDFSGIIY